MYGQLTLVDPDAHLAVEVDESNQVVDPVVVVPEGFSSRADLAGLSAGTENRALGVAILIDVNAPAGPVDVELRFASGASLVLPHAFEVAARSPIELAEGVPASGALRKGETALYRFGAAGKRIVALSAPGLQGTRGTLMLLGPSGSLDDQRSWRSESGTITTDQVYAIAVGPTSNSSREEINYELTARSAALGTAEVPESPASKGEAATAQPVQLPVTVTGGVVEYFPGTGFAEDLYRVEIPEADAGRALAISIEGPDGTFPLIRLLAADGETVLAAPTDETDITARRSTLISGPLPPGTYYVECGANLELPDSVPYFIGLALAESTP